MVMLSAAIVSELTGDPPSPHRQSRGVKEDRLASLLILKPKEIGR